MRRTSRSTRASCAEASSGSTGCASSQESSSCRASAERPAMAWAWRAAQSTSYGIALTSK
eukprot:scaffold15081_cov123-Isochrysis_galbana.AAC.3